MDLHFRQLGGTGIPIVILHGLFGSSKNWISRGRALSSYGKVYALDLRNHGDSPHSETHSLNDLVEDLEDWVERNLEEDPILVGHSMGGAAAMGYSVKQGSRLRALVVVDILPRSYQVSHEEMFQALEMSLDGYDFRKQIDASLADLLPDTQVRQFLLMNAEKTRNGYGWKIEARSLRRSTVLEDLGNVNGAFSGDALFVMGQDSWYWNPADRELITRMFPAASIEVIPHAGHWLHATHPETFDEITGRFLQKI